MYLNISQDKLRHGIPFAGAYALIRNYTLLPHCTTSISHRTPSYGYSSYRAVVPSVFLPICTSNRDVCRSVIGKRPGKKRQGMGEESIPRGDWVHCVGW